KSLDAQVLEGFFGTRRDVPGRKHVRERPARLPGPFLVPRRDLGGDDDLTGADVVSQRLADEALAVPVAVRQRGIEESDPLVHRFAQRVASLAVVDAAPLFAAESPAAEAELADDVAGRAEVSRL